MTEDAPPVVEMTPYGLAAVIPGIDQEIAAIAASRAGACPVPAPPVKPA